MTGNKIKIVFAFRRTRGFPTSATNNTMFGDI